MALAPATAARKTANMFSSPSMTFFLPNDAATTALGVALAQLLCPGDTVLLSGGIGAGKTHLARAFIQARLGHAEDVPSPSFTLVQTYHATDCEIWHADLYRLSHPDEVLELGLEAAFETEICFVEWPDRLGVSAPSIALNIALTPKGEGREAVFTGGRPTLLKALQRIDLSHA